MYSHVLAHTYTVPTPHRFDSVAELLKPVNDGVKDRCFISESYDATSHFETAANDVLSLYERITGIQCFY